MNSHHSTLISNAYPSATGTNPPIHAKQAGSDIFKALKTHIQFYIPSHVRHMHSFHSPFPFHPSYKWSRSLWDASEPGPLSCVEPHVQCRSPFQGYYSLFPAKTKDKTEFFEWEKLARSKASLFQSITFVEHKWSICPYLIFWHSNNCWKYNVWEVLICKSCFHQTRPCIQHYGGLESCHLQSHHER